MRSKIVLASVVAVVLALSFFLMQATDVPTGNIHAAFAQQMKMEKPTKEDAELGEVRKELTTIKGKLTEQGKYNCCIAPTCDFCALAAGKCPCGKNVAEGKPVCGTCAGGWAAGYGQIPDVDPAKVQALSGDMAKMMYGMRAKHAGMKMEKMEKK